MNRTEIIKELSNRGYNVSACDIQKNGVFFEGITIKEEGACIAPTIYTEKIIEKAENQNLTLDDVVKEILEIFEKNKNVEFEAEKILSPDYLEKNLRIAFFKHVQDGIVVRNTEFEGIKSILMINANLGGNSGTIKVNESILRRAGISIDEAWKIAEENTLNNVVVSSLYDFFGVDDNSMYTITNKEQCYGASAVMNKEALAKIAEKIHVNKLILIPSSIHEMLALPYVEGCDIEGLCELVKEVNSAQVEPHEQLSDRVYVVEV